MSPKFSAFKYSSLSVDEPDVLNSTALSGDERTKMSRIRILTLKPGEFNDDICIDLETVELNLEEPVQYEALSYVWGSTDQPDVVYLGSHSEHYLKIHQNLAIALRHLRHSSVPRKIWIDAICIDQSNVDERSQQVAIMGDIYRMSHGSILWLGSAADDSDYAIELLRDLGSKVEEVPWTGVIKAKAGDDKQYLLTRLREYKEREVSVLLSLFQRPWFDRLWIRQEVYLTQAKATVQVGLSTIAWRDCSYAAICIWTFACNPYNSNYKELGERLTTLESLLFSDVVSLVSLRRQFGRCHCRDPRDRVYGIINMLPEHQKAFIGPPDYSLSVLDVWKKAILAYINHYHSAGPHDMTLSILMECLGKEPFETPSWMPRWEVKNDVYEGRTVWLFGTAGRPFKPKIKLLENDILRILGIRIQVIKDVYLTPPSESWKSTVKSFLNSIDFKQEYPGGGNVLEACALTFSVGNVRRLVSPPDENISSRNEITQYIETIIENKTRPTNTWDDQWTYDSNMTINVAGHSLIKTEDGYIGVAPLYAKSGDMIVAFAGRSNPMVLRPSTVDLLGYHLIGPCFIQGFMSNEAFLGPLPANYHYVDRYLRSNEYTLQGLYDQETRKFVEDPRLESWSLVLKGYPGGYRENEMLPLDVDFDDFRSMNVDVEYFDII